MSAVTVATPTAEKLAAQVIELQQDAGGSGVPKRELFTLAKEAIELEPAGVEELLAFADHDTRVVAVSIMDFQARRAKLAPERRRQLFELYLRRHDRIDTWDLVDRAAPYVLGGYLYERPREPLYELAGSAHWYERRSAIVATYYFIRQDDLDDTFAIGDLLAHDPHDLVQKAVGGWVREAGKRDQERLLAFLDKHAATMPRVALRYAIEKLEPAARQRYLEMGRTP
jgi:3-methyladenine DNA glycosylase AlkD